MWKLVLLLSLVPLAIAWLGRHWFWTRVRFEGTRRDCGTSVNDLRTRLGFKPVRRGTETHAAALGNALRECGLLLLEKDGDPVAKARIKGSFLTRVMPALAVIIAVFAILSQRVATGWAIAGGFAAVAFWTLIRLTGLVTEWRAVTRATAALQQSRALKRVDDQAEVIRCAKASVWNTVWPF